MKNSKKIAIIAYHKSYNYGAFIQCYSLANKLKHDFPDHSVEVIDYMSLSAHKIYKNQIKSLSSWIHQPLAQIKLIKRNHIFDISQKHLPLSSFSLTSDSYDTLFARIRNTYDIIITGSDMVWNWNVRGFPNAYFLNSNLGAKKMSYAASSYGQDYTQVSTVQSLYLKEAWSDFVYLGVRDKATEEFVKSVNNNLRPVHNCDPAFLLDLKSLPVNMDLLRNKLVKAGVNFNKPLIGIMGNNILGENIKRLFSEKFQIIAVYEPNKSADIFLNDLNPFEWARVFSFFTITFTHFFHGTLLSLLNSTPTIIVEGSSNYAKKFDTKIKDVLQRLDLMDLYFEKEDLDLKGWSSIEQAAHNIIKNFPIDKIRSAMENEAKSYDDFKNALRNQLEMGYL